MIFLTATSLAPTPASEGESSATRATGRVVHCHEWAKKRHPQPADFTEAAKPILRGVFPYTSEWQQHTGIAPSVPSESRS